MKLLAIDGGGIRGIIPALVLQAIAAEPGRVQGEAYRFRHGLPAASTVQRAVETLASDELVTRGEDGAYRISEPFLREWILLYAA